MKVQTSHILFASALALLVAPIACGTFDNDLSQPPPPPPTEDAGTDGVAVSGAPSISLTVTFPESVIVGTTVKVDVVVPREGGGAVPGPIKVELEAQEGITAPSIVIPSTFGKGTLDVSVAATRKHGKVPLVVKAISEETGAKGEAKGTSLMRGASGALDNSFANGGVLLHNDPANGQSAMGVLVAAIEADKLLVARNTGAFGVNVNLLRLNEDGSLDKSFGGAGTLAFPTPNKLYTVYGLFPSKTGSIAVSGVHTSGTFDYPFIARFTAAAGPDTTFGTSNNGIVDLSDTSGSLGVSDSSDNYYLASGSASPGDHVRKLTSSGAVDSNWGVSGLASVTNECAGGSCYTTVLGIEADGEILSVQSGGSTGSVTVVHRFTTAGTLAKSSGELQLTNCGAISPDSSKTKTVFLGCGTRAKDNPQLPPGKLTLIKLDADLKQLQVWGNGFGAFAPSNDVPLVYPRRIVSVGDKVVVASEVYKDDVHQFGVFRLTSVGTLDASFAGVGYVFFKSDARAKDMAIDSLGRMIVVGNTGNGSLMAARFWP